MRGLCPRVRLKRPVETRRLSRAVGSAVWAVDRPGNPSNRKGGVMGDRTQRLKGKANEVKGKTKAGIGYETGSAKTEAKGAATAAKGKVQQAAGKARSQVKKRTR